MLMKIVLALEADVQHSRFIFSPRSLQNDGHRHMYVSSTPAILELKGLSIAQKWGGGVLYTLRPLPYVDSNYPRHIRRPLSFTNYRYATKLNVMDA